jgi:hypothetical protein
MALSLFTSRFPSHAFSRQLFWFLPILIGPLFLPFPFFIKLTHEHGIILIVAYDVYLLL